MDVVDCRNTPEDSSADCGPAVRNRKQYENDYCAIADALNRRETILTEALYGTTLDIIVSGAGDEAVLVTDTRNVTRIQGFTGALINEIAIDSRFTWRAIFVKEPDEAYNHSWDNWILDWANRGDLLTTWFQDSDVRRDAGLSPKFEQPSYPQVIQLTSMWLRIRSWIPLQFLRAQSRHDYWHHTKWQVI